MTASRVFALLFLLLSLTGGGSFFAQKISKSDGVTYEVEFLLARFGSMKKLSPYNGTIDLGKYPKARLVVRVSPNTFYRDGHYLEVCSKCYLKVVPGLLVAETESLEMRGRSDVAMIAYRPSRRNSDAKGTLKINVLVKNEDGKQVANKVYSHNYRISSGKVSVPSIIATPVANTPAAGPAPADRLELEAEAFWVDKQLSGDVRHQQVLNNLSGLRLLRSDYRGYSDRFASANRSRYLHAKNMILVLGNEILTAQQDSIDLAGEQGASKLSPPASLPDLDAKEQRNNTVVFSHYGQEVVLSVRGGTAPYDIMVVDENGIERQRLKRAPFLREFDQPWSLTFNPAEPEELLGSTIAPLASGDYQLRVVDAKNHALPTVGAEISRFSVDKGSQFSSLLMLIGGITVVAGGVMYFLYQSSKV